MARKRGRKLKGHLYKRGKVYYLEFTLNGKRMKQRLLDENKQPITNSGKAAEARDRILDPYRVSDEVQLRQAAADALKHAEDAAERQGKQPRSKVELDKIWDEYLESPDRPDSGEDTLRQYSFQWNAFVEWLQIKHDEVGQLCDVNRDVATQYAQHLAGRKLAKGTIVQFLILLGFGSCFVVG